MHSAAVRRGQLPHRYRLAVELHLELFDDAESIRLLARDRDLKRQPGRPRHPQLETASDFAYQQAAIKTQPGSGAGEIAPPPGAASRQATAGSRICVSRNWFPDGSRNDESMP